MIWMVSQVAGRPYIIISHCREKMNVYAKEKEAIVKIRCYSIATVLPHTHPAAAAAEQVNGGTYTQERSQIVNAVLLWRVARRQHSECLWVGTHTDDTDQDKVSRSPSSFLLAWLQTCRHGPASSSSLLHCSCRSMQVAESCSHAHCCYTFRPGIELMM